MGFNKLSSASALKLGTALLGIHKLPYAAHAAPGGLGFRAICPIGCASCGWRLRRRVSSRAIRILRSKWACSCTPGGRSRASCSGWAARVPARLPSRSIWP